MLHWSLLQASSLLFTASLDWRLEVLTLELLGQLVPSHSTEGARGTASWLFLLAISLGQHRTNHGCVVMVPGGLACLLPLSLPSLLSCGGAKTHRGWTQTSNTWLDPMSPCRVNSLPFMLFPGGTAW